MPFKPETNVFSFEYIILISILIVVFFIAVYFKKKTSKDNKILNVESKVEVLDKIYLDNKTKLFVVKCHGNEFFVVSNANSVSISEKIDKKEI